MQNKNGKGRDLEQVIYKTLKAEIISLVLEPGFFLQEAERHLLRITGKCFLCGQGTFGEIC